MFGPIARSSLPPEFLVPDHASVEYCRRWSVRPSPGLVTAEMEDYAHHFRVHLTHDGERVLTAMVDGVRVPWTSCPTAASGVTMLAGKALVDVGDLGRWGLPRDTQCVHASDIAVLAARHTLDDRPTTYEIRVTGPMAERRVVRIWWNGSHHVDWEVEGQVVVGPAEYAGLPLMGAGFFHWMDANTSGARRELVEVARRAQMIASSRALDMDGFEAAGSVHHADSSCYTYRPEVSMVGLRNVGTTRHTELDPAPSGPASPT